MVLTSEEFREQLPVRVREALPAEWGGFHHRSRFSLVQFWYGDPAFHYEVWPQRRYNVIELGLHLEHQQPEWNAYLHGCFDRRMVEIRDEVGELWLEKWDRGWHKLYRTYPFSRYTQPLLEQVSQDLARLIVVLQPFLEEALEQMVEGVK